MHTTKTIKSNDFEYIHKGGESTFEDILPDFNVHDRIGIISEEELSVIGISTLIMGIVTKYYDFKDRGKLSNEPGDLRIYPEIFIFHINNKTGKHGQIDVWPPHREVIVEDDPERVLEAVNDRGITRLFIEDNHPAQKHTYLRETVNGAKSRIKTILAYSRNGHVENSDITIKNNRSIVPYIEKTIDESEKMLYGNDSQKFLDMKQQISGEELSQSFRNISFEEALFKLVKHPKVSRVTQNYIDISAKGSSQTYFNE